MNKSDQPAALPSIDDLLHKHAYHHANGNLDLYKPDELKQALFDAVMEQVIGADVLSHRVGFGGAVMGFTHDDISRNKLKSEQRQALKQLFYGEPAGQDGGE